MRSAIVTAVLAALAFGISNTVALAARAPQETVPPAPCMGQGDVCTNLGAAQCCGGMVCQTLEGAAEGFCVYP
ncbi:hypothetical protein DAEQUDRAFT_767122 [Daedalea quercina L-15889]|uniref:Uncharacterized protein n=1 Tax=Daedalea quercina L-15889 TaxID=1314783 RepID=A0A165NZE0_9APHY|nr:hypothetical protein DAEQUDRAFT_767122 [Daedalea quercina L-15889]